MVKAASPKSLRNKTDTPELQNNFDTIMPGQVPEEGAVVTPVNAEAVAPSNALESAVPLVDLPVLGKALDHEPFGAVSHMHEPLADTPLEYTPLADTPMDSSLKTKAAQEVFESQPLSKPATVAPVFQKSRGLSLFGFVGVVISSAVLAFILLVGAGFGLLRYGAPTLKEKILAPLSSIPNSLQTAAPSATSNPSNPPQAFITSSDLQNALAEQAKILNDTIAQINGQTTSTLEARISPLEATLKAIASPSLQQQTDTQNLAKSEARLASTVSQSAEPLDGQKEKQISSLEASFHKIAQGQNALQSLVLALDLHERVLSHQPYQDTLNALNALAGSVPDVTTLEPLKVFATSGLPEPASLLHSLADMIAKAETAAQTAAMQTTSAPTNNDGSFSVTNWLTQKAVGLVKVESVAKDGTSTINPNLTEQQTLMALRLAIAKGDWALASSALVTLPARFQTPDGMASLGATLHSLSAAEQVSHALLENAYKLAMQSNGRGNVELQTLPSQNTQN